MKLVNNVKNLPGYTKLTRNFKSLNVGMPLKGHWGKRLHMHTALVPKHGGRVREVAHSGSFHGECGCVLQPCQRPVLSSRCIPLCFSVVLLVRELKEER